MSTHEKIRKLREAKDLTQEFMAHELNISPKTYSRVENGESPLKVEHLLKISEILNVSVEDLLSSSPVTINIDKQENNDQVVGINSGTVNNYNCSDEIKELKDKILRLEAAMEKLIKQKWK